MLARAWVPYLSLGRKHCLCVLLLPGDLGSKLGPGISIRTGWLEASWILFLIVQETQPPPSDIHPLESWNRGYIFRMPLFCDFLVVPRDAIDVTIERGHSPSTSSTHGLCVCVAVPRSNTVVELGQEFVCR